MTETILRDGEIAIIMGETTVIMNVNTALELKDKLDERKNKVLVDKGIIALIAAIIAAPDEEKVKPDLPPAVKSIIPSVIISDNASARNTYNGRPWVYIDNFGNVFGTMGECDYQHQMPGGSTQKMVNGKQKLGYAEPRRQVFGQYRKEIKGRDDETAYDFVYVVKADKFDLYGAADQKILNENYKKYVNLANSKRKEALNNDKVINNMQWPFYKMAKSMKANQK